MLGEGVGSLDGRAVGREKREERNPPDDCLGLRSGTIRVAVRGNACELGGGGAAIVELIKMDMTVMRMARVMAGEKTYIVCTESFIILCAIGIQLMVKNFSVEDIFQQSDTLPLRVSFSHYHEQIM